MMAGKPTGCNPWAFRTNARPSLSSLISYPSSLKKCEPPRRSW